MIRLCTMLAGIALAFTLVNGADAGTAHAQGTAHGQGAAHAQGAAAPAAQAKPDTTIVIRSTGSTLEFEPPAIAVKQGTRVKIVFVNAGTLPHNIVFARHDDFIDELAAAASEAYATGFVPVQLKDRMIAWSTMASPGETVELTFVVPPPGEYTYVCLISGHANSMLGTLRSLR